ncbi:hypothetical protein FRC08_000378 [Ceratobasidium sp. 394]|nr:hypothetical protein FRC08_000378 [Ceratobasidium sp. 394]
MSLTVMLVTHGRVSPVPPALSTDLCLADGKLHVFLGIQKLEAEREHKMRECRQSMSGIDAESPEREVERRLHHQASGSQLILRFQNTGVTPPKQEYIDVRVDSSTPSKCLPTTRDGVRKRPKVFQSPASSGKPVRNHKALPTDVLIHRGKGSNTGQLAEDPGQGAPAAGALSVWVRWKPDGIGSEPICADAVQGQHPLAVLFGNDCVDDCVPQKFASSQQFAARASFVMAQVNALLAAGPDAPRPLQLDDPPCKLLLKSYKPPTKIRSNIAICSCLLSCSPSPGQSFRGHGSRRAQAVS